jgi:hypothetical protein
MFIIMSFSAITNDTNNNASNNINMPEAASRNLYGEVVNTWGVSGKTCSSQSVSEYNNSVTLTIDVTSFSESHCAGPTPLMFMVSGHNVHTVDISGKGKYSYSYIPGIPGNVCFYAKYLSGSEFEDYKYNDLRIHRNVFFRNSYSTFGGTEIKFIDTYPVQKGYDGNNVIYLASPGNGNSHSIYGLINLGNNVATVDKCNNGNLQFENDSSSIEAFWCVEPHLGKLEISVSLISMGASNDFINPGYEGDTMVYGTDYQHIGLTLINAPSSAETQICTVSNSGFNVTGNSYKGTTRDAALEGLAINLLSILPYVGYATSMYGIYSNLYVLSGVEGYNIDNDGSGTVFQNFEVTGGEMSEYSGGKDVFGSIENITIHIPYSDLNNNFQINAFSTNYYECGGILAIDKSANASKTINAVTSSAIYGEINATGELGACSAINGTSIYVENMNNGNIYNVSVVDGRYLFFAQPDTEYKFYSLDNGSFKLLRNVNGTTEITTGGAGSSIKVNFEAGDFNVS